jgi:hypothetical protein
MCLLKVNARSRVRRNKLDRVAGQQASRVAASVSQLPSWMEPALEKWGAPFRLVATVHSHLVDEAKP